MASTVTIDLRQVGRIAAVIRSFQPAVVHCHQYTPLFYGSLAALRARGACVLFTEHGRHWPDNVGWKRRVFNRVLMRTSAHITAVCQFTRRRLIENEGVPADRGRAAGNCGPFYHSRSLEYSCLYCPHAAWSQEACQDRNVSETQCNSQRNTTLR